MLREIQLLFSNAVLQGDLEAVAAACEGAGDRIRLGLRVYANNAVHGVVSAARSVFADTAAILGDEEFTAAALLYARHEAMPSPVIVEALAGFPDFLKSLNGIDPRAAQCARFEALRLEALHADDADPLPPAQMTALAGETFARMHVVFHPSFRLYRPEHPTEERAGDDFAFLSRPHALLRVASIVETIPLTRQTVTAIERLAIGRSIGEVLEACEDIESTFSDLGRLISAGAVIHLH